MVWRVYPQYRDPDAVDQVNPHLHNVPLQIAAERGLPALAIWIWFMATLTVDLGKRFFARAPPVAHRRGAGRHRLDAHGRVVRVQLRRLRVPDAVPDHRHAAVRGGPPSRILRRMTLPRVDAQRAAKSCGSLPACRSSLSATSCSIASSSGASAASLPKRRCRSCASSRSTSGSAARPTSRTTSRRSADTCPLVGVVGIDAAALRLREQLAAAGIGVDGLVEDRSRPTTEKVRIVTERNQQVARVDYERDSDVSGDLDAHPGRPRQAAWRRREDAPRVRLSEGHRHAAGRGSNGRAETAGPAAGGRPEDPASRVLRRRHARHP